MITPSNWTESRYIKEHLMCLITLGADPETINDNQYLYFVTTLSNDYDEVDQVEFSNLYQAISFINKTYKNWKFTTSGNTSKDGCSTCVAH